MCRAPWRPRCELLLGWGACTDSRTVPAALDAVNICTAVDVTGPWARLQVRMHGLHSMACSSCLWLCCASLSAHVEQRAAPARGTLIASQITCSPDRVSAANWHQSPISSTIGQKSRGREIGPQSATKHGHARAPESLGAAGAWGRGSVGAGGWERLALLLLVCNISHRPSPHFLSSPKWQQLAGAPAGEIVGLLDSLKAPPSPSPSPHPPPEVAFV